MRLLSRCALAIAFLLAPACSPDDDDLVDPSFPDAAARDLQQTLDDIVAAGVAPGVSVAIDHPQYGRWAGAAGIADLRTHEAMTPAHRIRAGSMLKTLVATAVLRQVEAGRLSLDARLTAVLPTAITARIANAGAITVRMLLLHTSGIPEFADGDFDGRVIADPRHVWTLDEVLARVGAQTPAFAPGAGWQYSNTNYILLGEILAATTGEPWRRTVGRVIDDAGLFHTALPREGQPKCAPCARGYEPNDGAFVDVSDVDPSMAGASGGHALVTTPRDLVRFLDALAAGTLFDDPATLSLMMQLTAAPVPAEAQTHVGLGVTRFEVGDVDFIGHLGTSAGYQGFMLRQPATGIVVAGDMNQRGDLGAFILPVLEAAGRLR